MIERHGRYNSNVVLESDPYIVSWRRKQAAQRNVCPLRGIQIY